MDVQNVPGMASLRFLSMRLAVFLAMVLAASGEASSLAARASHKASHLQAGLEQALLGKHSKRVPEAEVPTPDEVELAKVREEAGEVADDKLEVNYTEAVASDEAANSVNASLAMERDPQRACGILWYYHIPKTAGESVNWWLFKMKEHGQFDDVLLFHNMTTKVTLHDFLPEHIYPFLQAPEGRLIAVHHHDRAPGLYGLDAEFRSIKRQLQAKGCNLYRMTTLREPMELLRSALVFYDSAEQEQPDAAPKSIRRMEDVPARLVKGLKRDKIYDNLMTRYILNNNGEMNGPKPRVGGAPYPMKLGGVDETAMKAARNILRQFQFVGFADNTLQAFMDFVANHLKLRNVVQVPTLDVYGVDQVNMAANTDRAHLEDEDVKEMIKERIEIDQLLFKEVSAERGRDLISGENSNQETS